jgi:alcohol dehydrogenase
LGPEITRRSGGAKEGGAMDYQEYISFSVAGEIIFGNGALKHLPAILKEKLKVKRPLLVSDQGVAHAGHLDRVSADLKKARIPFETFDKVEPEPSIDNVLSCSGRFGSKKFDSIIALGGGSVIDCAKAVSVLLKYGGDIKNYFGQENIPGETLPLIAIPTTAGTGSEVSAGAILTDAKRNTKVGIRSNLLRPRIALLDPMLTLSCPKSVTASSGFDVLAHAVESYTMIDYNCMPKGTVIFYGTNPITEALATAAIKMVAEYLRIAVHQLQNREAREKMMFANILAGCAFSNSGVTHTHNITYPVGAKTHAPHGVTLAALLPAVLEFNLPTRMEKLAHVAALMGDKVDHLSVKDAAHKGIDAIRDLIRDIQLPSTLKDLGVTKKDLPVMAKKAMPVLESLPWNPRGITVDELIEIYNRAYQ